MMKKNDLEIQLDFFKAMCKEDDPLFQGFKKGWEACQTYLEQKSKAKSDRKNKKFVLSDFVAEKKDRLFTSCYYQEDGKRYYSNGYFMVQHKEYYDIDIEKKFVNVKTGLPVTLCFPPSYLKIIPDKTDLVPFTLLAREDFLAMAKAVSRKTNKTLSGKNVLFGDFNASILSVRMLSRFLEIYSNAILYVNDSNILVAEDEATQDKIVLMISHNNPGVSYNFTYDQNLKVLLEEDCTKYL